MAVEKASPSLPPVEVNAEVAEMKQPLASPSPSAAVVEENGEREPEPLRNGAEHTSETDSSDGGLAPGNQDGSGDPRK